MQNLQFSNAIKPASLLALFCLFLMPAPAHAYLDAGTSSSMVQILAGGLLTLGFVCKNLVSCIRRRMQMMKQKSDRK